MWRSIERTKKKWRKNNNNNNAKSKKVWAEQEREKRDWENSPSALFGIEQIKYLISLPVMRKHSNYYYYSMHSRRFVWNEKHFFRYRRRWCLGICWQKWFSLVTLMVNWINDITLAKIIMHGRQREWCIITEIECSPEATSKIATSSFDRFREAQRLHGVRPPTALGPAITERPPSGWRTKQ